MPDVRIADLFNVQNRFLRSAHLERDFEDVSAVRGYVLTPQASSYLNRLASGLTATSGQRAWRITGDYGVGKSSFALVLAHLFSGRTKGLMPALRDAVDFSHVIGRKPKLIPVLVMGSRASVAASILRAVERTIDRLRPRGRRPRFFDRIERLLHTAESKPIPESLVLEIIEDAANYAKENEIGNGFLIILDELGKFLEYAALNPDRQDIYFLQILAEAAARSGDTPLFVVGLLHQGFNAYADKLSETAQREWQKVAGRFEELLFDRPLDQTAALIADALNVSADALPKAILRRAKEDMAPIVKQGWYGPGRKERELVGLAPRLYPLHPTILPVLTRLFSRFGQNERSLFSFLLSSEPFGLQSFAVQSPASDRFYRIHDLYDYARAAFGHLLGLQGYRNHWNLIESVVESFPAEHVSELRVLKTIAMLNLIDDQGLIASPDTVMLAVAAGGADCSDVKNAIARLQKKRVIYLRGVSGGYCLWPHTSINIDNAYRDAIKVVGPITSISSLIASEFDTRPVVARRHYIETGNLRHFDVRCVSMDDFSTVQGSLLCSADGIILLPLCETDNDRRMALQCAHSDELKRFPAVIVAVPKPLQMLESMVQEVRRWSYVSENTPELAQDRYAAEEVSRQLTNARRLLRDRIQDLVGLRTFTTNTELEWYRQGKRLRIHTGRDLLSLLSDVCDELYPNAPCVRNELINRSELSSAAAAARMRLIEGLVTSSAMPLLGMDEKKKPPEMSMYLSVLQRGKMHVRRGGDTYAVIEPSKGQDPLNVRPVFERMLKILREQPDARVPVVRLFDELRRPPYGVRGGLLPLLLAVFAIVHEEELAFYEDGAFVRELSGEVFQRLIKVPESFEMQNCRVSGVRAAVFARLAKLLGVKDGAIAGVGVLEVVRPLCQFAAQLPPYALRTKHISEIATAIRSALTAAKEPAALVFRDLPLACGYQPFGDGIGDEKTAHAFVSSLKTGLDELRGAYPHLLDRIRTEFLLAIGRSSEPFERARLNTAALAERLLVGVHEPRLRGYCLRLADRVLPEQEWVQAFAGYVSSKAPTAWLDADIERFREELHRLAQLFTRVHAAAFGAAEATGSFSARLAVTLQDGSDVARVVHLNDNEEALSTLLEREVRTLLAKSQRVGLVAITRVLLKELASEGQRPEKS